MNIAGAIAPDPCVSRFSSGDFRRFEAEKVSCGARPVASRPVWMSDLVF